MNPLKNKLFNRKKALYLYVGFFSCMVVGTACKEKSLSNADAIPEVDNIHTFAWSADSISVTNSYVDSLLTNDINYPLAAIGKIANDPFFGKTNAGLYVQFSTPSVDFSFPENAQVDSAVLSIPYYVPLSNPAAKLFFGDTSKPLMVNVHRITEPWTYDKDKKYYSNNSLSYNTQPLVQQQVAINALFDSLTLGNGDQVKNLLRIKLPDAFTNELVSLDPLVHYTTVLKFHEYFPGFYITADPNSNTDVLGMFNINDGSRMDYNYAQITFYYKNDNDSVTRKIGFPYRESNSAWFNSIERNYQGVAAQNYLQTRKADSLVLQSAPGLASIVEIPINRLPNSIVNKAELTLTMQNVGGENYYLPPNQLIVRGVDEDGKEYNIADYFPTNGFEYIGGGSIVEELNGSTVIRYRLNFPRELQKAKDEGKQVLKLKVSSTIAHPGFYRAVFHGPGANEGLRPQLSVIYSIK